MRGKRGCLACCYGSVFEHSRAVTCLRRVMNYPSEQCFRAPIEQGFQYEIVQTLATRGINRIFYRSARKLVSKSNCFAFVSKHSSADAFFESARIRADCVIEQPHLSSRRND